MKRTIRTVHEQGSRASQQDRFAVLTEGVQIGGRSHIAVVVADGVGGHEGGDKAAEMAVRTAERLLLEGGQEGGFVARAAVLEANRVVASRLGGQGSASTLIVAILGDDSMVAAWVGDSRIYVASGGSVEQLTCDQVGEDGALAEFVGMDVDPEVGLVRRILGAGMRIALATDGSFKASETEFVSHLCTSATSGEFVDRLGEVVRSRSKNDNATCVCIDLDDFRPAPAQLPIIRPAAYQEVSDRGAASGKGLSLTAVAAIVVAAMMTGWWAYNQFAPKGTLVPSAPPTPTNKIVSPPNTVSPKSKGEKPETKPKPTEPPKTSPGTPPAALPQGDGAANPDKVDLPASPKSGTKRGGTQRSVPPPGRGQGRRENPEKTQEEPARKVTDA